LQKLDVLSKSYFQSEDVTYLAKDLLGKLLCTKVNNEICKARIVETEAYEAPLDRASHAFDYKRTKRTEVMYAQGGTVYVYLCYGIHNMFNIVTGPKDLPHAVLFRAVEPIENVETMHQRSQNNKDALCLASGPGNLCKALGIQLSHNGIQLKHPLDSIQEDHSDAIWVEQSSVNEYSFEIVSTPRVGISYAKECANWDYRFRIKDHKSNSKPNKVKYESV